MNFNTAKKQPPPRPPEKGSFPLDHDGECVDVARRYMECVRENRVAGLCKELSKSYITCRMDKGLMAREDLSQLGFLDRPHPLVAAEPKARREETGFVAGVGLRKPQVSPKSPVNSDQPK
eukprot:TRINITY_DN2730_c0_g1_i1.p1 TRINITY_DN2730_c0_g1~~TRINITY_DN2730_c0_g1_i1.p1  ORF type:complete len:120 (-),score=10.94 TRINITY_DN2730_c0_g1_i1:80-439(-)